MNYASTANIEEVMKFYNLGDKTFETNFNCDVHFKMFRHNPEAKYEPNGGRYLQIMSSKDLYKQTIVVSSDDAFPASFLNTFIDYS